jgi:hypothetical protein
MGVNLAIMLTSFVTLGLAWAVALAEPPKWMACEAILLSAAALVIRELRSLGKDLAPVPSRRTPVAESATGRSRKVIPFPQSAR